MQRDIDETEEVILRWADWMRSGGVEVAGFPAKAPCFQPSWIKDADEMVDAADAYEMGKANAAIDSLTPPQQRILYKRHGLGFKVWRFENEEAAYLAAKDAFKSKYFAK